MVNSLVVIHPRVIYLWLIRPRIIHPWLISSLVSSSLANHAVSTGSWLVCPWLKGQCHQLGIASYWPSTDSPSFWLVAPDNIFFKLPFIFNGPLVIMLKLQKQSNFSFISVRLVLVYHILSYVRNVPWASVTISFLPISWYKSLGLLLVYSQYGAFFPALGASKCCRSCYNLPQVARWNSGFSAASRPGKKLLFSPSWWEWNEYFT